MSATTVGTSTGCTNSAEIVERIECFTKLSECGNTARKAGSLCAESTSCGDSTGWLKWKEQARVFKSALGFDQSNWEELKRCILDELPYHEAVFEDESRWGKAYRVDLLILGVNSNTASVRTVWIIRHGTDYPSLITLWVLP